MDGQREVPYGAWPSPIGAGEVAKAGVKISQAQADPIDADLIWWAESRSEEGGRTAIMRYSLAEGKAKEHTPAEANVRSLVHEYGGGAWWPHDGDLLYVDYQDQRLRRIFRSGEIVVLTPEPWAEVAMRFADGRTTPDGRWCVAVRETHAGEGEPCNEIVAIATDGSQVIHPLYGMSDFVMSPRVSGNGDWLAWISWNHPSMSWDSSRLHIARFKDGQLAGEVLTIGEDDTASYCDLGFNSQDLRVCCDLSGWWNLYDVDLESGALSLAVGGEFDIASPAWVFGMKRWAALQAETAEIDEAGEIVEAGETDEPAEPANTTDPGDVAGSAQLFAVAGLPGKDELLLGGTNVEVPYSSLDSLSVGPDSVVAVAASYGHSSEVVRFIANAGEVRHQVICPANPLPVSADFVVEPEGISFPTTSATAGTEGAAPQAHALFYRPTNPSAKGPSKEAPPLLVVAHGGPTACARRELQLGILYWTSRGIAVADVDYRGSSRYGTAYRSALNGQWGIADVADCVAAAKFLASRGDVDPKRLMIRGQSAGGFTVLAALAAYDVFSAAACRYGIADLEALAGDTHKFESRYLDTLIGPYPQEKAKYVERSPIHHVESIDVPLIVLQGSEDVIVPPAQSELIVEALRNKGVEVEYLLFEGEQHGFRQAVNIERALEAELKFFGQVMGFTPA